MITCNVTVGGGVLSAAPIRPLRSPHILDLHQAIVTSDASGVRRLANCGLDLGTPVRGTTALSFAVYRGDLNMVKELVLAGAPLNRRSKDHLDRLETPIISAIRLGHGEIVEELVNRGARLDTSDFFNQSPLWFAVKEQRLPLVKLLLKSGAPIHFTKAAENPLNFAVQYLGYKRRREMAIELVGAGLPLSLEDYMGHSPLYWAIKHLDIHFFRLLVEGGANLGPFEWLQPNNLPQRWKNDEQIIHWLQMHLNSPAPLKRQCRTFIHKTLRKNHNKDVRPLLRKMPVPQLIQRFLLMEEPVYSARLSPPNHCPCLD